MRHPSRVSHVAISQTPSCVTWHVLVSSPSSVYSLGANELGDEGIRHIAVGLKINRSLKELVYVISYLYCLAGCFIRDVCLDGSISQNGVHSGGIKDLAEALAVNRSLKELEYVF